MKTILTRLFTVMLLIMVSLGAMADVKVLFGEKGDDKVKTDGDKIEATYDGGTIVVTQKVVDATKVTVFLTVTPNKGYTMQEKNVIEAYATAPVNIGKTRAPLVSEKLTLDCEGFKDEYSTRTYYVDVDPKLALWVKSADFQKNKREGGAKAGDDEETEEDLGYSGTYFIASNGYDVTNTAANYYLCPTEDWYYYKDEDPYYTDTPTDANNPMPFMTTYQCRNGVYDVDKATWEIQKVEGEIYYIKTKDGKYLTFNKAMASGSANRIRVHIESSPSDMDYAKFEIKANGTAVNIHPVKDNDGWYMNLTDGNKLTLKASGKEDGPNIGNNKKMAVGGTIEKKKKKTVNSLWTFELFTPEISINSNECSVTLSYPITTDNTVEIRYTTDGATPTESSTLYKGPFTPPVGTAQIKVAAFKKNISTIQSPTVTYEFPKLFAPTYELNQAESKFILNTSASNGIIYYKTGGANPTIGDENDEYTAPFNVTQGTVVKAIVAKNCYAPSQMMTHEVGKVETPIIAIDGNKVTINCSTYGAVIHYTTDGNAPTAESPVYTLPLSDMSGKTIKAIAMCTGDFDSDVASSDGPIVFSCQNPVIRREVNNKFSILCSYPADGVTIHYTIDGSDPTEQSSAYTEQVEITTFPVTVKARAFAENYNPSAIVEKIIRADMDLEDGYYIIGSEGDFNLFVQKVNNGNTEINAKVTDNFSFGSQISITQAFCGIFDGGFFTISGLRQPLFSSTSGAVIKNVMLKDVQISGSGAKGAIAGIANGYTRIYNCGILPSSNKFVSETSVISSSDGYCGGLVGELNDDSRVVNCFSYAKITGGTVKAGIVGYNQTASTTEVTNGKYENLKTMVVNCMFYGDITGSTGSVYPVYGGSKILNTGNNGINNYNYYRAEASITPTDYNCSWPASEENLTRFEYYRYLLNSNRALCGWWVGAPSAPSTMPTADVQAVDKDASLMAKWVLDPSIAPYPILKSAGTYPSVINIDPVRRIDPDTKAWVTRSPSTNNIQTNASPDIHGETLGSISVSIDAGSHHSGNANVSRSITITAMDIDNNDFCYGKIQLPYYNEIFGNPDGTTWSEKYGDNYTDMVVTGWDITTSEGTAGIFSEDPIAGYNFADRNCTAKDTHRTFAQGGFYYVPYGVTSITITAHWAKAYYLSNTGGNYERVYFSESNVNKTSAGQPFAPAGTRSFGSGEFGGQTINNGTIASILTNSNTGKENSVYDCAIVLVSNYQYRNNIDNIAENDRKPFTLMTVDLDFDNEPDYCFEWQFGGGPQGTIRAFINPVRFDFLPIVELGIAMKENESKYLFTIGKVTPYGHFEITETAVIHMGQFEYDDKNRAITGPVILNNGLFDQICRGSESDGDQNVNYFILGGHVKMPSFTPGSHVKTAVKSRHCAVNVLGGEIANFYLSGNYIATPTNEGNPHCYIDGGKLDFVASGAKEQIVGDVFWKIDHANIGEFYGGGINADKRVKGSINITINRSKVTKFCGGPQFGDMENGKTVTTSATGTTFGVFYGAGNGGTCYSQYDQSDVTSSSPNTYNWETTSSGKLANYTALKYRNKATGYHAKYELEMINSSAGTMNNAVCRTYMYSAQFATTNTGNVTSTLTDCTIEGNFFGGGLLGGVNGNVTSTLMGNTVVQGNAYGAGYGVADLTVDVLPKGYTPPKRDENTAVITAPQYPDVTTYYWTHDTTFGSTTLSTSSPAILNPNGDGKNYLYTEISLDDLGAVDGNVTLNIQGSTEIHGNVFGGGDRGVVKGSTEVNIQQ